jgi:DNA-binding PadR family transcriptional regulator
MFVRKVILGFIRIHILHHASTEDGIYGSWMLDELKDHGYDISPGTLYPILHEMRDLGILDVEEAVVNGKVRKLYRSTARGDEVLMELKESIRQLSGEVLG